MGKCVSIILAGTMMTRGQTFEVLLDQQGQDIRISERLLRDYRDLVVLRPLCNFLLWQTNHEIAVMEAGCELAVIGNIKAIGHHRVRKAGLFDNTVAGRKPFHLSSF